MPRRSLRNKSSNEENHIIDLTKSVESERATKKRKTSVFSSPPCSSPHKFGTDVTNLVNPRRSLRAKSLDGKENIIDLTKSEEPKRVTKKRKACAFSSISNMGTPSQQHKKTKRASIYGLPMDPTERALIATHTPDTQTKEKKYSTCGTEYAVEMYEYHRSRERSTSARPFYMKKQPDLKIKMRSILICWLMDVHDALDSVPETLYLTINLLDRYLERKQIPRKKLQLVGITAFFLASKYEHVTEPNISTMVKLCDKKYTKEEILEMEQNMLNTLNYRITVSSALTFLLFYLKAAHADRKIIKKSCKILQRTLFSYELLKYLPSQLAAASVFIAYCTRDDVSAWNPTLLKYEKYHIEDILPVARAVTKEKSATNSMYHFIKSKTFARSTQYVTKILTPYTTSKHFWS